MTTYTRKKRISKVNYRKIYEHHYGPIPIDNNGRSFEIHHIDGNHTNNNPENLIALTIQEHYDIHYNKKDYYAAKLIAQRMKKSPEEIIELNKLHNRKMIENKTHPFLGPYMNKKNIEQGTHLSLNKEACRKNANRLIAEGRSPLLGLSKKRVEDGSHNFLGGEIQRLTQNKLKAKGLHNFSSELSRSVQLKRIAENSHPFQNQPKVECPHCKKIGLKGAMKRWHFENCKKK
jgi:UDP-N-acetylmuramoylalanine-D-glutamate ligase